MGYDACAPTENFFYRGGWDSYRGGVPIYRGWGVELRILLIVHVD